MHTKKKQINEKFITHCAETCLDSVRDFNGLPNRKLENDLFNVIKFIRLRKLSISELKRIRTVRAK